MPSILAVSGSPSAHSRTVIAVDRALDQLASAGFETSHIAVRDLPPADLLSGARDTPAIWDAADAVARADGIVIATPLYKASYTGLLKAFLDLLPENALAGKTILPLATGGTVGHLLAIDYALRPVLTALGAGHVVHGRFLLDQDIVRNDGAGTGTGYLTPTAEARLNDSVGHFIAALGGSTPLPRREVPAIPTPLSAARPPQKPTPAATPALALVTAAPIGA